MQRKNKVFLGGVIYSDIPMEARFVTPSKGCRVLRRCPGHHPKSGGCPDNTKKLI